MKSIAVTGHRESLNQTRTREKRVTKELRAYEAAKKEGQQPDGTTFESTERSKILSDRTGAAYNGADRMDWLKKAGIVESVTPVRSEPA